MAGNHVIIKHAESEYGFYAHLVRGSIGVKVGEVIRQGDVIGQCGFSGNSTEPHLHFHLQDAADFYSSIGLPVKFENVIIDRTPVQNAVIERGTRVANDQS